MNTFLPYPSFPASARVLDWQRLGKQRLEAYQAWVALTDLNPLGWKIPAYIYRHPGTLAWTDHEDSLAHYFNTVVREWIARGFTNSLPFLPFLVTTTLAPAPAPPAWIGGEVHSRHRAKLLAKDPIFYSRYEWTETPCGESFYPPGAPALSTAEK